MHSWEKKYSQPYEQCKENSAKTFSAMRCLDIVRFNFGKHYRKDHQKTSNKKYSQPNKQCTENSAKTFSSKRCFDIVRLNSGKHFSKNSQKTSYKINYVCHLKSSKAVIEGMCLVTA